MRGVAEGRGESASPAAQSAARPLCGRKENGLPRRLWHLAMTVVGEGWSYYSDMVFTAGGGRFLNRPYEWSQPALQTENPLSHSAQGVVVCGRDHLQYAVTVKNSYHLM